MVSRGFGDTAPMDLGLAGRGCLVTGASRGIGLATARLLAAEGANVLLCARDADTLDAATTQCAIVAQLAGGQVASLTVDVTDPAAPERLLAVAEERFGGLDVLVNNAGTTSSRPLATLTDDEWQAQWELNVMAPLRLMRLATPRMADRGWGRVVNVASAAGKRPGLHNAAYSVTKAAELALSRVVAEANARHGVLVAAVAPGPVATPLWTAEGGLADQASAREGTSSAAAIASTAQRIPLGRLGTEEEIASVIAFLCSERSSNVVGAAWSVDGGYAPLFI